MDPGEGAVKPKRKVGRFVLLGLVLFLVLGFTGIWVADEAAYRKARAAGIPLELEDLYDTPMPADEDNAAVGILEAGELLLRDERLKYRVWAYLQGTPEQQQFARNEVAAHAPALARLQEAVARPEFRDPEDIEDPTAPNLLYIRMQSFLDLVYARILIRTRDGQIDEAIADFRIAVALLNLEAGYSLPPYIPLQELILACTSEAELSALRNALADIRGMSIEEDIRRGIFLTFSRMRNGPLMEELERDLARHHAPPSIDPVQIVRKGYPKDLKWRFQMARLVRWVTPAFRQKMTLEEMEKYFGGIYDAAENSPLDQSLYRVAIEYLPAANYNLRHNLAASREVHLALIDARVHYLQTGLWPKSFSDLPNQYTDPFTGKPLFFSASADGLSVWSVGRDGQNDNGKTRSGGSAGHDIVASIPPPPATSPPSTEVPDPLPAKATSSSP